MHTRKVYVEGMHCDACSALVERQFRRVAGVRQVRVNLADGSADITYENRSPGIGALNEQVTKFGYAVSAARQTPPREKAPPKQWAVAALIAAGMIGLFALLQNSGLVKAAGASATGITYGVALLVGIVASLSTCLAVVGAIVISFAEMYQATPGTGTVAAVVQPNLLFHVGRIGLFAALGGALGLVGGELSLSGRTMSVLTIGVGIVMALLGLNILGFAPSLTRLGIRMPARLTTHMEAMQKSRSPVMPLVLGGLTFFLPCGFTQSMQIMALGSGSFQRGALIMGLFAVGTFPILFAAGMTASWTRRRNMAVMQKAAGLLVIAFAVFTISSGTRLVGFTGRVTPSTASPVPDTQEMAIPGSQRMEMHVTYGGFEPAVLHVKKDVPVTFVVYGDEVTGCTNRIVIPSLGISQDIGPGQNVIRFTPRDSGTIPYSCWMGMVHGSIVVDN